jgi:hypothetical protein
MNTQIEKRPYTHQLTKFRADVLPDSISALHAGQARLGCYQLISRTVLSHLDLLRDIGKLTAQNLRVLSVTDVEDGPVG